MELYTANDTHYQMVANIKSIHINVNVFAYIHYIYIYNIFKHFFYQTVLLTAYRVKSSS